MTDQDTPSLDSLQRFSATQLMSTLKEFSAIITSARVHEGQAAPLIARLAAHYEIIEEMAFSDLRSQLKAHGEITRFAGSVMATGSDLLLSLLPDDPEETIKIKTEAAARLVVAHSADHFRKMIRKGVDASRLIVPLMQVSDTRRDIRALLMHELADKHLARTETGSVAWSMIIDHVTNDPQCALELIRVQRATFPKEVNEAAVESWNKGHGFNTVLHLLLDAPLHIFQNPRRNPEQLVSLHEAFSSGHGLLRLTRHFGDLHETRTGALALYEEFLDDLGAPRP
jgi:hypothetical protein